MKPIRNSLIAFAAMAGAFAFAPASADQISPASDSSLCLDMGSKADLMPCGNERDQRFELDRDGRLRVDGGCLAVSQEYMPLVTARCGRGDEFRWYFDRSGALVNGTGLCADVEHGNIRKGQNVLAYRCNGKSNQRWTTSGGYNGGGYPGDEDDYGYGAVMLQPQHAYGMCLDVRGGGSDLIIYNCHGKQNQRFELGGRNGSQLRVNGNCVTAPRREGDSLYIARCSNNNRDQRWEMGRDGSLRSGSGGCADVADRGTRAGTPVILYRCTGSSNQRFQAMN